MLYTYSCISRISREGERERVSRTSRRLGQLCSPRRDSDYSDPYGSLFPPVSSLALSLSSDRPSLFPPQAIPRPSFSFALSLCRAESVSVATATARCLAAILLSLASIASTADRSPVHPRPNRVRIEARIAILARWWRVAVGRVGKIVRGRVGEECKVGDNNLPDNSGSPRSVYHSVSSAVSLTRGWGKLVLLLLLLLLQPLLSVCSVWGRFIQRNCRERDTCWHGGPLTIPDTRARVPLPPQPPFPVDEWSYEFEYGKTKSEKRRGSVERPSEEWKIREKSSLGRESAQSLSTSLGTRRNSKRRGGRKERRNNERKRCYEEGAIKIFFGRPVARKGVRNVAGRR